MAWLRDALDRTWLVTSVFAAASGAFWARFVEWRDVAMSVGWTLLIVPVAWHVLAGRRRPVHLMRAMFAGAVSGLMSQLAVQGPYLWPMVWPSNADGALGADTASGIEAFLYIIIAICSTIAGAILGLLVALAERGLRASRSS